ncbi:MAG: glycine cleavage system protein H [Bacteroidota bacterium]
MTVLLFLTMIIMFLGIDFAVQRKNKYVPAVHPAELLPIRVPSGIFFAPSHTWLSLFPSGNVRIGADDFVLRMMRTPDIAFLKSPGSPVKKGDPLIQLKEGSKTLTVHSPIDGEIITLNEELEKHPQMLKDELFSNGWAYTIKPHRTSELTQLLLGERSRAWIQQELGRLRDFIVDTTRVGLQAPVLLQDGGAPVEGLLDNLNAEQCEDFEKQFLFVK